jgi:hypothetical protein
VTELRYVALNGSLGTGFKVSSLEAGIAAEPAFIGCDAGSSDGGPHALGAQPWHFSRQAATRDLGWAVKAARRAGVPLLIGSSNGAGTDQGVDQYAEIVREVAAADGLKLRLARIYTEPDRETIVSRLLEGRVHPLIGAPEISPESIRKSARMVAMMGTEPFEHALAEGADVVLAGRASDTSIYSAIPEREGFDRGLVWHAAKVMECGTGAASKRTGQDSMLCTLYDDSFVIEGLDPAVRCSPGSVAAHTLYENGDPFHLVEPSGTLDTTEARFEDVDGRRVRVSGSKYLPARVHTLKLEGVEFAGYASAEFGSIRDPIILGQIDSWVARVRELGEARIASSLGNDTVYQLNIRVYGANATLGPIEPTPRFDGHEALVLFDVVAPTQEMASAIVKLASYAGLHLPVPEWTAGSITGYASPYSPGLLERGPVFRFNINHVVEVDDPLELCRFQFEEVG